MKKNFLLSLCFLLILIGSKFFLTINHLFILKWWVSLFVLGIAFFPMTSLIFNKIKYGTCNLSKILGIALPSLSMWLLSYAKILKYTRFNCWLIIFLFALINLFIFIKNKAKIIKPNTISNLLSSEIIFLGCFIIWSYIRCFSPEITYSTEKFMNYGFLNTLFNCTYLPAQDMWLSGYNINYYYFGQYISSFLTKVSFSGIAEGFNLSVATITTFSSILPLILGYNLGLSQKKENKNKISKFIPTIMATLCALAISIGGTLYYPIYNFILDRDTTYYYWEDTRYIGYRPDTNDKTINEILPYSNVIGDLHAHHIDTIFVFFTLSLILNLLLNKKKKNLKDNLLSPNIILFGIIIGIQKMTNFWDFPIYLTVLIISFIFNNLIKYKFTKKTLLITLSQIIEIILLSSLITLPFTKDLYMSATKVHLTHVTSPFYKMLVLWGLPTLCVLSYIIHLIVNFFKSKEKEPFFTKLSTYINRLNKSDIFIFIIGCCAIGLMIIPEIIYVKDIYGEEFKRANTVYKLCYQSELLFDISATYILIKFLYSKSHIAQKIVPTILLIAFISTFGYGINAINYVTNNFNKENIRSLDDTENYIKNYHLINYNALQWIKENIARNDIILEKPSGSYNINSFISVFAGNPTVLGWHGHEWIWRANKDYSVPYFVNERWYEIHTIYSSSNIDNLKELIAKYNISYIYIYDSINNEIKNMSTLKKLGKTVYEQQINNEFVSIIKITPN